MIGIIIAFKTYRYDLGIFGSEWVGLENFKFLFRNNIMWRITRNTIGMNVLFLIVGPLFGVTFAILLNEVSSKFVRVYQTTMFFPHYLSWVVVSYLFVGLFDMELGILNRIIGFFGGEAVMWYNEAKHWPVILVLTSIWKHTGYHAVIYFAAIMGINHDFYEAARIDGASKLQQIRYITVPLLMPTVIMLTLIGIGNIFRADFGMFYFLTKNSGALYSTTDVIDTYVFRTIREFGQMHIGTAVGLYQALVGLILVTTTNFFVKKYDKNSALY